MLCLSGAALAADSLPASVSASTNSVHGAAPYADYQIGVKDQLAIDVFDVPSLSQTVEVDNAGAIDLPLIGQVQAAGRTPNQLSQAIAAALSAKYMKDPIVTVAVKDAASKKFTVSGEVTEPGMFEVTPGMTLTQAVALAKGPDQVADPHHVSVVRGAGSARTVAVYDLEDIHDGKVADPAIQANDTIVVDSSGSRKFVRDYGSIISILGWLHP
jgi:polysaccharide export outer membrane protein